MTNVLIPVKSLKTAKSRLSNVLRPEARSELVLAMLTDLFVALKFCELDRIWLIGTDRAVFDVGKKFGANVIHEENSTGYNRAIRLGLRKVDVEGPVVILPADLPGATTQDLNSLISPSAAVGPEVRVVPDKQQFGTNGLYLSSPDLMNPAFGTNSFKKHLRGAGSVKARTIPLPLSSLADDMDEETDFLDFAKAGSCRNSMSFTQRLLDGFDLQNATSRSVA